MKDQMMNGLMGVLTFYLVATAWLTAMRREGETGIFDWGAKTYFFSWVSCP